MRYFVCMLGLVAVARLFSGCDPRAPDASAAKPRLLAAGDLNNLYVVQAQGEGDGAAFRFWQRDARGTWHEAGPGQGAIAAAAAWRENLLVFFPSGRYGLFGLGPPLIQPSPVPSWTPAAVGEDGLAIDAFGWNAAGEPIAARLEDGKWSWRRVDADLKRGKVLDPVLARFAGRLFLVWREEQPSLTGPSPSFRLWFAWQDKDGWHVPTPSRLYVTSAPTVAAAAGTLACLFQKAQGDGRADQWTLATYATADEDWHEVGPLGGVAVAGPLVLVRSDQAFCAAALEGGRPSVATIDVSAGRAGPFLSLAAEEPPARPPIDYNSLMVFGMAALSLVALLITWHRSRRAAGPQVVPGEGGAGAGANRPGASGYVPAPILRRGVAIAIDHFLLFILVAPFLAIFSPELLNHMAAGVPLTLDEMVVAEGPYLVVSLVYFVVAEGAFGRTFGKRLMRIHVRGESGTPISFWQALVRNLLRIVDFFPTLYVLGMLFIVMGPRSQRLGDRAAHTIVVADLSAAA
jgi:uncharacterized RDD family membrane protein YckC